MIVKKVKYKKTTKPKSWQIGDLVDYIRSPRDSNPLEKIEHSGSREFFSTNHVGQKKEMIGLAEDSVHSKMPVSHWIFSWQENEQPTPDQVEELVDIFLERMELSGHQTMYGLHYNTENYHVHIAVNRMSRETGKVVQPHKGFDIEAAHKIVAEIEYRQGWAREENGRYMMDDSGRIVRAPRPERGPSPTAKALDFEAYTGEKSAQRVAQERGYAIITHAVSWPELHQKLAAAGLRFEKKGSGALIIVGDIPVKASSVDRAFSMGNLCKRLGEFIPGEYGEPELVAPEPVSSAHVEDWKEYRAERDNTLATQSDAQYLSARMELKTRHKLERKRLARRLPGHSLSVINHARHGLAMQQREERRALAASRPRSGLQRQSFKSWLKAHGRNQQADSWRYRNRPIPPAPSPPSSPSITGQGEALAAYAVHREILHRQNARLAALAARMALFSKVPSTPPESSSRQDARIALLMRAEGHSREAVMDAICRCAQESRREEKRDWRRYAIRTAAYAFGLAGDMELAKMPRMEPKPIEAPSPPAEPVQVEPEPQWEAPRLRMR
ncbi:MAG: relaxase/mobilization nuclease domain-containing protein [Desulfovibrionaceae bacterium]|nr:relaxase/mobilization nuclease domain-containing protein [Desulfovibrionaceae bacterium]